MANGKVTETALKNELREDFIGKLRELLEMEDYEVLRVSNTELAIPETDKANNDRWLTVKISVPKGEKLDEGGFAGYDGYDKESEYNDTLTAKEKADKERADKKAKKIAKKPKADKVEKITKPEEKEKSVTDEPIITVDVKI